MGYSYPCQRESPLTYRKEPIMGGELILWMLVVGLTIFNYLIHKD